MTPNIIEFIGPSGCGKTILANHLKRVLQDRGYRVLIVDREPLKRALKRDGGVAEFVFHTKIIKGRSVPQIRFSDIWDMTDLCTALAAPKKTRRDALPRRKGSKGGSTTV